MRGRSKVFDRASKIVDDLVDVTIGFMIVIWWMLMAMVAKGWR